MLSVRIDKPERYIVTTVTFGVAMNRDVGSTVTTGELANAPATRDISPTLVVRRPDDEGRPEVPVTGRLHGPIVGPTGRSDWSVRPVG